MAKCSLHRKAGKFFAGLALLANLAIPGISQAAPLTLGTPLIAFDSGTTTYDALSGSFSATALPASVFDPTLSPPIGFIGPATATGTETVSINLTLDSLGTLIGGVTGDDLVVEGKVTLFPGGIPTVYDGILLTGEIASFSANDPSTVTDTYNLKFTVTGGALSSFYPGGGVGINLTSETSTFTGDFSVNFNGSAKGQIGDQAVIVIPDACTVDISATCLVNLPPESFQCETEIAATTLVYTGPSMTNVDVTLAGSMGGYVTYTGVDLVSGVTVLTAATEAGMTIDARPGDLGSKMTITVAGVPEVIHTSCSALYTAGQPAPLDSPKGAPSSNWSVVSFVDKNGKVVDSTPAAPAATCEIPPSGAGCYFNGKPSSITFEYTGGGCAMSDSAALTQGIKPPTCTGVLDEGLLAPSDTVSVSAPGLTVTPSVIRLGDTFTVSGNFGSSTTIVMTDANGGTETNTFHSSCSAPLEVGDVFGGLTMSLYNGVYGGTSVDFAYKVTNTGTTTITSVLLDDIFDGIVPGSPIASIPAGGMVTLSRSLSLINSVENPVTVSAISGTAVCDAMTSVTIHETPRMDKGVKGSKGSKRGSKKMKNKRKKGSHKRHKRSKGGHYKPY